MRPPHRPLFTNSRFFIVTGSLLLALYLGWFYGLVTAAPQYSQLTRAYALTAVSFLYLALLVTPFTKAFPGLHLTPQLIHARRALGVSAFLFAALHAFFAFTKELGGFGGLPYLRTDYLAAVAAGAVAVTILLLLALTSFDGMVRRLGPSWKKLHRFVYLAGVLVLFHALSIGTNFADLRTPASRLALLAVFGLFILEALRLDQRYRPHTRGVGVFTLAVVALGMFTLAVFAGGDGNGLSFHAAHQSMQPLTTKTENQYRVNVSLEPAVPQPGQETVVTLSVFDAHTGLPVNRFTQSYERFMHIIIVDSAVEQFAHVHPETTADGTFRLRHTFGSAERYHLYLAFTPYLDTEQQVAVSVEVGSAGGPPAAALAVDTETTKTIGDYSVTLHTPRVRAVDLAAGVSSLTYSLERGNELVTDLHPYVGAFGHLSLVNLQTYEFIHAHPRGPQAFKATDRSGPMVDFQPMANLSSIKPGTYRAFVEFAPAGHYLTVPFTITLE